VSAAIRGLRVSERQLRRRFTLSVGYGPATYLRVARLQRAVKRASRATDVTSLAADAGYTDQAHLSRECRALTGRSPREFFGRPARAGGCVAPQLPMMLRPNCA
jgi:AraC-like DNA-binding protein